MHLGLQSFSHQTKLPLIKEQLLLGFIFLNKYQHNFSHPQDTEEYENSQHTKVFCLPYLKLNL